MSSEGQSRAENRRPPTDKAGRSILTTAAVMFRASCAGLFPSPSHSSDEALGSRRQPKMKYVYRLLRQGDIKEALASKTVRSGSATAAAAWVLLLSLPGGTPFSAAAKLVKRRSLPLARLATWKCRGWAALARMAGSSVMMLSSSGPPRAARTCLLQA